MHERIQFTTHILRHDMGPLLEAGVEERTKRAVRARTHLSVYPHHNSTPLFALSYHGAKTPTRGFEICIHGRRAGIILDMDGTWMLTCTNNDAPMTNASLPGIFVAAAQAFDTLTDLPLDVLEAMGHWDAECRHNAKNRTDALFGV